jgi:hypothetical protein
MSEREATIAQHAAAAITGAVLPRALGADVPAIETLGWVLTAMAACLLADGGVQVSPSRWRLAARYLASVGATLAASHAAAAGVGLYYVEWRGEQVWPLRIGVALVVGLMLHRVIARVPDAAAEVWALIIQAVRKRLGLQ